MRTYPLHNHLQRHLVLSPFGNDHIRPALAGFHELLMHGFDGRQILTDHTVQASAAFLHIPLNPPKNPDIRIRIVGHTDDVGRDDYNYKLSVGRANSVKKEMVNRGIAPSRIETTGRGKKDPIFKNDTEAPRQMNRRVEIEILDGASVELIKQ